MPRWLFTPLAAFCAALAWSGAWITGKLAVASAPPLEISTVRFVIAAVVLVAIAIATRTNLGRGNLWPVVLAGLFGYCAYNAFVFVGLTMAPASDGALIVPTLIPVLTALAASFVGEGLTATKLAGFALASIGATLVIAAGQTGDEISSRHLIGDVLMLPEQVAGRSTRCSARSRSAPARHWRSSRLPHRSGPGSSSRSASLRRVTPTSPAASAARYERAGHLGDRPARTVVKL